MLVVPFLFPQTNVQGYNHIYTGGNHPSHPTVADWTRPGVWGDTAGFPRLLPQLLHGTTTKLAW